MSTLRFDEWYNSDGTKRQTIVGVTQKAVTDASSYSPGTGWIEVIPMTAGITVKSSTSRIMIMMTAQMSTGYWELQGKFKRKVGTFGTFVDVGWGSRRYQTNANVECGFTHSHYMNNYQVNLWYPVSYNYIDTPRVSAGTTVYYRLYVNSYNSNAVYLNRTRDWTDNSDYNGAPISSVTLMEIAA